MTTTPEEQIHALLDSYARSLNTSDASRAASCYAPDGVFMPTTLPTAAGSDVRAMYEQIFATVRLNVSFTVDELVVASDHVAYALTRSNGTQTVLATGTASAESNREMFIFTRPDGEWRISRYMFNKSQ